MESFLTTVSNLIREKELPALMIGGHAVTALGPPSAEERWARKAYARPFPGL